MSYLIIIIIIIIIIITFLREASIWVLIVFISRTLVPFFNSLYSFFFFIDFAKLVTLFDNKDLFEIATRIVAFIWWMENLSGIFLVFTPSVGEKHFGWT